MTFGDVDSEGTCITAVLFLLIFINVTPFKEEESSENGVIINPDNILDRYIGIAPRKVQQNILLIHRI